MIDYETLMKEYKEDLDKIKPHINKARQKCPDTVNRLIDYVKAAQNGKAVNKLWVYNEIDMIKTALKL